MRDDMFKIIVERPRWGAGHAVSAKLKGNRTPDSKQIGLKRHAWVAAPYTKHLNENLAPLVRFLRSRRGRKWDDVFSEICAGLDTGSTVKMHVRQHIDDFVLSRIAIGRHGEWMWQGRVIEFSSWQHKRFFVDPDDGLLKDYSELDRRLPAVNRTAGTGGRI